MNWPIVLLVAVCAWMSACGGRSPEAEDSRPNILFVLADDHAAHAVGAYGAEGEVTPNIDRLAREGMLFRNAFVTNSICNPSRATILTGQYGHVNGVTTNADGLSPNRVTLPQLLQRAGYQTALIGKWHLESEPTGFDHYEVLDGQGDYYNPYLLTPTGRVDYTGYVTDIITDRTIEWLKNQRDPRKPFLLMYQHKAPHRNWDPAPEHLHTYDDRSFDEPTTLFDDYSGRASGAAMAEMTIERHLSGRDLKLAPPNNINEQQLEEWNATYGPKNEAYVAAALSGAEDVRWKYQRFVKDYLRTIASLDENLGRVLDVLDEAGLAENTVVVYTSDQGFFLGDHGWYDKRWMYEESLRIPLVVRWPAMVTPSSRNDDLVQNLDFAQTFLDIADVSAPNDMQGLSFKPLLEGNTPTGWRDAIYYQYFEFPEPHRVARHYGVRTARYKLIHYFDVDEWELFDLDEDPNELNSVYSDPDSSDTVAQLKTKLAELRAQFDAPAGVGE